MFYVCTVTKIEKLDIIDQQFVLHISLFIITKYRIKIKPYYHVNLRIIKYFVGSPK